MAEGQNERGLLGKLRGFKEKSKAAEVKGNALVSQIENRVIANAQSVLPSLSPEGVDETLKAFWNTDEEVSASADVIYDAVDRVMERLRIVNPGLAKIIDEFDDESLEENTASYLTTMILSALTHDSTPRSKG